MSAAYAAAAARSAAGKARAERAHPKHRRKNSSGMSEKDKKKEKIRKRRIELQKALSRTKGGKKVTDEKDIAAGPAAAFPVKNREKKNRLKIKDD